MVVLPESGGEKEIGQMNIQRLVTKASNYTTIAYYVSTMSHHRNPACIDVGDDANVSNRIRQRTAFGRQLLPSFTAGDQRGGSSGFAASR